LKPLGTSRWGCEMPPEVSSLKPIPTTLVTGFLGSGKTTLLKRIMQQHAGSKLVLLVNEFSGHDVDGGIVQKEAPQGMHVVPVPGGSIFCTCLVAKFIDHLAQIVRDHEADPIDGLIIEASGVADPLAVRKLLRETGLQDAIDLRRVISVLDPGTLPRLILTLPNIRD